MRVPGDWNGGNREQPDSSRADLSLSERRRLAVPGVERHLMGQHPVSPRDELRSLIAELDRSDDGTDATLDRYGEGGPVAALESQVAGLLGKPATVMFPSGTMAQQSTLRVWSDRQGLLARFRPLEGAGFGSITGLN